MISLNTKLRLLLASVGVIVLLGLLCFALYRLKVENTETVRLENLAEDVEKKEETVRMVRELRDKFKEDIAALEALGSSDSLLPTIENIEAAGETLGLSTEIASVERESEEGKAQAIRIIVESTGSWKANFLLLKSLEALPQKVNIGSVYLSKFESLWRSNIELTLPTTN
jgi:hypothetical protein